METTTPARVSPAAEDAVRTLVRAVVIRLDESLKNQAPEWETTTRWERGQDGHFRELNMRKPALWRLMLDKVLQSMPEYSSCVERLKSDSAIGPHLDRLVGTEQMTMRLEADRILWSLIFTMVDDYGALAFTNRQFDERWREIVEFFSADRIPLKTVAPLPHLRFPIVRFDLTTKSCSTD